jgi:RNA polymerase sigma-70 factor (ECF subfamily)
MPVGPSFPSVLAAAKTGAEWAIAVLYRELQPKLLRYLKGQEPADAEDLASDVWLAVGRALPRFEGGEDDFQRWLFTIARRRVIDHRRSARHRGPAVALDRVAEAALGTTAHEPADPQTDDRLLAHLATLPPDQAEVVLLRVVADLNVAAVAAIMGKKPGTIRVLQHRALERLAERIAADPSFVTR